ncbi:hypothetical protein ZOD2009_09700 [Haladaptatus paucihalophilus DX253]|uniref:Uncharacterized protein n=1 Tax=Haladaptatus paucihalophilus DX253 TaxID=797209 RepID=E7QT40_HALPU|nr:hypothetical protein [Haladaptatus paucihalophilus]EFW92321.1 hypothetical protein ZOD2009_09700 [Haladaptatus paucihalophilus DX253]SHL59991.1 hypothetical protein SAMN05444342_4216 [Haladaptatus paucihalophilus DX253]
MTTITSVLDTVESHTKTLAHHSVITLVALATTTGVTLAQQGGGSVGSGLCGTPLADTINQAAPLVIGLLMFGGALLSVALHAASGLVKNPNSKKEIKSWRNNAAFTAVTAPLFAFMLQLFLGFTGANLANCINLVPFFN